MGNETNKPLAGWKFSLPGVLRLNKLVLQRYCEITIEEMERDLAAREPLDIYDEVNVTTYLHELSQSVREACSIPKTYRESTNIEELNHQIRLAMKHFPDHRDVFRSVLAPLPAEGMKPDVAQRLASFKRRIGDRFAQQTRETINRYEITSPIEHIFLMEWSFAGIENKYQVTLEPQAPIETSTGTFFLDFLICSADEGDQQLRIGIGLDGHEFHEKTKEQVAKDRKRERQLTESGITVLRFSGAEIVRNCRECIEEITRFLEAKKREGQ